MSIPKDDKAAFPRVVTHDFEEFTAGMTLRDYFAAAALFSASIRLAQYGEPMTVASECYEMADAMLKAREAK